MTFWAGVLLMFGAYMVTAEEFPLDMANNSVDDMYDGCAGQMFKNVTNEFLKNETEENKNFSEAWRDAEMYYNKKKPKPTSLEKEEAVAVYTYTHASPAIPPVLNKAVREQGLQYNTTFNYRSLHYFLTRAIQKLAAKHEPGQCLTAYRRTTVSFKKKDVLHTNIRFGQFTSSSLHSLEDSKETKMEKNFGKKSCFVITTCLGVDISLFSKFEAEAEILIPPYEVFKVTKIETRAEDKELPCEVVYTVESTTEAVSNYNCALFKSSQSHG